MSGGYQGTAVPPVGGISYHGYTAPVNWQDPAVSGQDLMVHRDVLRQSARSTPTRLSPRRCPQPWCYRGCRTTTSARP